LSAQIIATENQQYHEKSSDIVSGMQLPGSRDSVTVLSAIPLSDGVPAIRQSDGVSCSGSNSAMPVPAGQYSDL